jgi:uncharacterized membrane protein YgdD (TMEM256/DUF423 family)
MKNKFIITGILLVVISIMLGAFGAHGLKKIVDIDALHTFDVGVKYQMYQGLGFLVVAGIFDQLNFNLKWVYRTFLIGVLFFSISIYGLVITPHFGLKLNKVFGPITPIGGLLMIIGWVMLLVNFLKYKSNE